MPLAPEGWELSIIHLARRCQALTADGKACRGSLRQLMGETIHQVRTGMLHPEYCQQRLPACGLETHKLAELELSAQLTQREHRLECDLAARR